MYSTVVSDVGTVRSNNQDSAFAGEHLIAICDGMGGHAGGDTASTIAIRSLAHIEQDNVDGDVQVVSHMMATSVMAAHDAIVGKAKRERRLAGMGTTVTSVALVAGCWVLAHIGDSRAYLLHDGHLVRMTSDHSYVQHLIDTGRISEAEARNRAYAALKNHRKRIAQLDEQMERDNARMEELLAMMADPDFYVNEDASSDAIAEHAKLKQRLAAAEEEWFTLTEELEAEMARQQERA